MSNESIAPLFSTPAMTETFSLTRQLRAMMRFEWGLSSALEKNGLAEKGSAAALEPLLDASFVDVPALLEDAKDAGNIAIPFIKQLTTELTARNPEAARTAHLGATSQDVLDTALVLQIREALDQIQTDIFTLDLALATQVRTHAETVLMGRTWMQPGPPVTLGLKLAGTLAALRRHSARLYAASERVLVLQFGGAVGTLAALGEHGAFVSADLAATLQLDEPELPWHTQRDNLVETAQVLALITGTLAKFAKDIALLMQAEVAEVSEPSGEGRGASSTIPHKRNPVACASILAAATRIPGLVATMLNAMPQEHERGLGLWPAEWETLPEVFRLTAVALHRSIEIAQGLEVSPERMRANMDAVLGLPLTEALSAALAPKVGRPAAHAIVRKAAELAQAQHLPLASALRATPEIMEHLSEADIQRLTDPANYLGSAQRFILRVLGDPNVIR
jgi:3-carboxy-cis,cis-muconate cycloisomerase